MLPCSFAAPALMMQERLALWPILMYCIHNEVAKRQQPGGTLPRLEGASFPQTTWKGAPASSIKASTRAA